MRYINSAIAVTSFVLISLSSFAQKATGFIGINGGVSLPTGNWAKANYIANTQGYQTDPSGYAATGGIVEINGAYFFSKNIGIGALVNYGTYKTKDLTTLSGGYQESFDVDQVTTTANSYKIWNFLPGLFFHFPLASKLSVTAHTIAGIAHVTTPQYSVDVEDGGIDDGTFYQESSSKTAFAFNVGAGLSYRVLKQLAINVNAAYFYSKPDFAIINTARQNAAGRLITNYNQPLAGVNVTAGIAYVFSKK